jgi:hypothetical protein
MAIDYDSGVGPIPNNTGNFPNVVSNNVSAPAAGDGTPYVKAGIDDAWGRFQDLLNRAGLTPNGSAEAAGSSQHFEALRRCFSAPGEVVIWHGQADPATLGLRLLLLQGQSVLITSYPDLDAAVYVGDANNPDLSFQYYYRSSDPGGAVRDIAGPYLNLADARGCALRGHDPTGIRDPLGAVRKFPDIQLHAVQVHRHEVETDLTNVHAKNVTFNHSPGTDRYFDPLSGATGDRLIADLMLDANTSLQETRMINLAGKICVRY